MKRRLTVRVLLKYGDSGTAIQAPAPSLPFPTIDVPATALPEPYIIASAPAYCSPATADELAERIGPALTVRLTAGIVLRLKVMHDSIRVELLALRADDDERDALLPLAPQFIDGLRQLGWVFEWLEQRRERRELVRVLQGIIGGGDIAVEIGASTGLLISAGPQMFRLAIVGPPFAEVAERGLFAQEKAPAFGGWGFGGIGSLRLSKAQRPWTRTIA